MPSVAQNPIGNSGSGMARQTATVKLSFTLPGPASASRSRAPQSVKRWTAAARTPKFVSPLIASAVAIAYQQNAPGVPGNTNFTGLAATYLDLSPGSPNCTANPNGSRSCTVFLPAPLTPSCAPGSGVGCDFFELDTYDDVPATNDPSGDCGGGALGPCTGVNGVVLSIGTDGGNGVANAPQGLDQGYKVTTGSSVSVSLGLQGVPVLVLPTCCYLSGNPAYPPPVNNTFATLFVAPGVAGSGANAPLVLSNLFGAPVVIDNDFDVIAGGNCTNGDLFATGITTNFTTNGVNDFAVDGAGGTNQVALKLQPCGTSGFQALPAQGINVYFPNDQLQLQYLGGGSAGNEEIGPVPPYFASITGSLPSLPASPLAANWNTPPATSQAYGHPQPLNPVVGCGAGTCFPVGDPIPPINVVIAPLFAQTFTGAAGANENDSAAGGPNPGHAVINLTPGASGRIYADQLTYPDQDGAFLQNYAATPSAGCSSTVNGTPQVSVSIGTGVPLDGSHFPKGYGMAWLVNAGNLASNASATSGNGTTSCVVTLTDGFNSVPVWVNNGVGNGTISIPLGPNLFVANQGNNTVTVYPTNNLGTANPIVISNGVNFPSSLAVDASGNLFVANLGNNTVTEYLAGNYSGAPTVISNGVNGPQRLALDAAGNLFVAIAGVIAEYAAGNYTGAPTVISNGLSGPLSLGVDRGGNLFVGDCGSTCGGPNPPSVLEYAAGHFASAPVAVISNGVLFPDALAFDPAGDLFVANLFASTVTEYFSGNLTGAPLVISNGISGPHELAFDQGGDLFVANLFGNSASEYLFGNYAGAPVVISNGVSNAQTVRLDPSGNLYVANCGNACGGSGNGTVTVYPTGNYGGAPAVISTGINGPVWLAIH